MRITALRIGSCEAEQRDAEPANWISPVDLASMIRVALEHPGISFEVVHAVTQYDADDIGQEVFARRFGFRPGDPGGEHARAMRDVSAWYPDSPRAREFRGGVFASGEPSVR
jgi:hypothetical protein